MEDFGDVKTNLYAVLFLAFAFCSKFCWLAMVLKSLYRSGQKKLFFKKKLNSQVHLISLCPAHKMPCLFWQKNGAIDLHWLLFRPNRHQPKHSQWNTIYLPLVKAGRFCNKSVTISQMIQLRRAVVHSGWFLANLTKPKTKSFWLWILVMEIICAGSLPSYHGNDCFHLMLLLGIHFPSSVTIRFRNGSILLRVSGDLHTETRFLRFFLINSCGIYMSSFLCVSSLFEVVSNCTLPLCYGSSHRMMIRLHDFY